MLPEVYESDPVHYTDEDDPTIFGGIVYNAYLQVPPRRFFEALDPSRPFIGSFARPETTRNGVVAYYLVCQMHSYRWPSWAVKVDRFDGVTGDFLDVRDKSSAFGSGISLVVDQLMLGRNGEIWRLENGWIRLLDPVTWEWDGSTEYDPARWSPSLGSPGQLIVDRPADRVLARDGNGDLGVYALSSGLRVATILLPAHAEHIFFEDASRAYVAVTGGLLVLVDYIALRVLGVYRIGDDETLGIGGDATYAWDPVMRRILVAVYTPDAEDGTSTTRIRGYYPRPAGVGITPAIPLQVPREGRTVEVVARLYGDAGEGIAGAEVLVDTPDAAIASGFASRITDRRGYVRFPVACGDAGTGDVDLEVEV